VGKVIAESPAEHGRSRRIVGAVHKQQGRALEDLQPPLPTRLLQPFGNSRFPHMQAGVTDLFYGSQRQGGIGDLVFSSKGTEKPFMAPPDAPV
jgi:hypothetical protein